MLCWLLNFSQETSKVYSKSKNLNRSRSTHRESLYFDLKMPLRLADVA